MTQIWSPSSWRSAPAKHIPTDYPDPQALAEVEATLASYPPLIYAGEARNLKAKLAEVAAGRAFLLQGGDCAESFKEFHPNNIRDTFRTLMSMAVVLTYGLKMPVVKIGRVAGQFAKPRSEPVERRDGRELPSYRGDNINGVEFTAEARIPDPQRLITAYGQSAATLNLIRAFATGGYADLHKVRNWTLEFVNESAQGQKYRAYADAIADAVAFMEACGLNAESVPQMKNVDLYTSHEALLLGFEQAMTREDSTAPGEYFDTSAHFLWIGDRTRQLDGAHVEFLSGVQNPIGMKCGPSLAADDLLRLIERLNPKNEPGRLTLITRFGAEKAEAGLPHLVEPVVKSGYSVVWSCDPMHGNTFATNTGRKTRDFDKISREVQIFMDMLPSLGAYPGGVHVEMTGRHVTECVGGAERITAEGVNSAFYETHCDPRLNGKQALELAFTILDHVADARRAPAGG